MSARYIELVNFGYAEHRLTADELSVIRNEANSIRNDFASAEPFSKNFANNIQHQYAVKNIQTELAQLIGPRAEDLFKNTHPYNWYSTYGLAKPEPLVLQDSWIDFQAPGEFSPLHSNEGIISFILWLDIPYTMEAEKSVNPALAPERNQAGQFQFVFNNITGGQGVWNIPVDHVFENRLIIFPSKLLHTVYPFFSSKEYRVSISGNFGYESK